MTEPSYFDLFKATVALGTALQSSTNAKIDVADAEVQTTARTLMDYLIARHLRQPDTAGPTLIAWRLVRRLVSSTDDLADPFAPPTRAQRKIQAGLAELATQISHLSDHEGAQILAEKLEDFTSPEGDRIRVALLRARDILGVNFDTADRLATRVVALAQALVGVNPLPARRRDLVVSGDAYANAYHYYREAARNRAAVLDAQSQVGAEGSAQREASMLRLMALREEIQAVNPARQQEGFPTFQLPPTPDL